MNQLDLYRALYLKNKPAFDKSFRDSTIHGTSFTSISFDDLNYLKGADMHLYSYDPATCNQIQHDYVSNFEHLQTLLPQHLRATGKTHFVMYHPREKQWTICKSGLRVHTYMGHEQWKYIKLSQLPKALRGFLLINPQ